MKIAFFVYPSAFQNPGGGEIMLLKTKEALENKGVSVKLFNQWEDKLKDYDILHVFGSVKECLGLMQTAKALGVKVVLSPIFWSTLERSFHEYGSFSQKLLMAVRHITKVVFPFVPSSRRKMLTISDIVLPNSTSEADQISRLFSVNKNKMKIVYLGADEKFLNADKQEFIKKYGFEDFVLSVGRIEPRKNQLNLIKAMKRIKKQLVLIGNPVIGFEKYYEECKRLSDINTVFIERLPHESSLLASAYAACNVFVLQGWFETPGLVALEAGLAGARLAVTNKGSTEEYLKDYVEYFSPSNVASIKKAVLQAMKKEKANELRDHIKKHFLWSEVALENIKIYKGLLK